MMCSTCIVDELRVRQRERQHMFQSARFYRAVRDHRPVWKLEDMRLTDGGMCSQPTELSPSDALVYAIIHDHQEYVSYLLRTFPEEAQRPAGHSGPCVCPAVLSHATLSVRYGRVSILNSLLDATPQLLDHQTEWGLNGCLFSDNGKSPLHVACELLQPRAVITLLGHGAHVHAEDKDGVTPLDLTLQHLRSPQGDAGKKRECLDALLMFTTRPRFKLQQAVREDPSQWSRALEKSTYYFLTGKAPQTLVFLAMQSTLRHIPPQQFLNRLRALPIPNSLKPVVDP